MGRPWHSAERSLCMGLLLCSMVMIQRRIPHKEPPARNDQEAANKGNAKMMSAKTTLDQHSGMETMEIELNASDTELDDDEEIPFVAAAKPTLLRRRTNGNTINRTQHGGSNRRCSCSRMSCCTTTLLGLLALLFLSRGGGDNNDNPSHPNNNNNNNNQESADSHHNTPPHKNDPHNDPFHQTDAPVVCMDTYTESLGWAMWKEALGHRSKKAWCASAFAAVGDDRCRCTNPLLPVARSDKAGWMGAFERNKNMAQKEAALSTPLDLVMIGDSIVEHWTGHRKVDQPEELQGNARVYEQLFRSEDSLVRGLMLGIGGDKAPNVLYRLRHGELAENLTPKVWWILVGTNDLFTLHCNVDATFAGILQVVDHLRQERPDTTTIVLHSLLPRGDRPLNDNLHQSAIADLNARLECYARNQGKDVEFFNSTDLFLTNDKSRVNATLLPDFLHPSAVASVPWGAAIVKKTLEVLGRDPPGPQAFDNIEWNAPVNNDNDESKPTDCTANYTSSLGWLAWKETKVSLTQEERCSRPNHCPCASKFTGEQRTQKNWVDTFQRNQDMAKAEETSRRPLDLLLLGDSITEHWVGTNMGKFTSNWHDSYQVYKTLFRTGNSFVHGLALGIGGDRVENLLHRIQAPEFGSALNPRQIWIAIGTNDLYDFCTFDTIAAGIINLVDVLRETRPTTTIVLHSVLPRGGQPLDQNAMWEPISRLNAHLECYASNQTGVEFLDATDFFLANDKQDIDQTLLADTLHPNSLGYAILGEAIVRKSLDLLGKEQPAVDAFHDIFDPYSNASCVPGDDQSQGWLVWKESQNGLLPYENCRIAGCRCPHPALPDNESGWVQPDPWEATMLRNKDLVAEEIENARPLDLVIYGDSIVEGWLGTSVGQSPDPQSEDYAKRNPWIENSYVYESLFRAESSLVRGVALGIGGDQTQNVLYRLENGELPEELNPPLFWVLVGTNNLVGGDCDTHSTLTGIIAIVETLRQRKPNATVAVHSILPRDSGELWAGNHIWPTIASLNQLLECFASSQTNVHFFNGTDYFLTDDKKQVNSTTMPDLLHPNGVGSIEWGEAIVRASLEILGRDPPGPGAFGSVSSVFESDADSGAQCQEVLLGGLLWEDWVLGQSQVLKTDRCYPELNGACGCQNPTVPHSRGDRWQVAFDRNKQIAQQAGSPSPAVVHLGDSIMEFFAYGEYLGSPIGQLSDRPQIYKGLFQQEDSPAPSIALGISGDVSVELLYRIQNGEMPEQLNPKIWWLLIGTNDLGRTGCNYMQITAGVISVVKEIQRRRPDAMIVVNALLPRGEEPLADNALWHQLSLANQHLECFASGEEKIRFVNDTDVFMTDDHTMVNQTRMNDWLHPSAIGYMLWGERIVASTAALLQEIDAGNT